MAQRSNSGAVQNNRDPVTLNLCIWRRCLRDQRGCLSRHSRLFARVLALIASLIIEVADQWERAVVLRLGKFRSFEGPGYRVPVPEAKLLSCFRYAPTGEQNSYANNRTLRRVTEVTRGGRSAVFAVFAGLLALIVEWWVDVSFPLVEQTRHFRCSLGVLFDQVRLFADVLIQVK
ncbi:hypothetical protein Pan110_39630 [Gimesia panareensis]|nr:hypothetical protein Pan110_39630 [Gimesia panareensis]